MNHITAHDEGGSSPYVMLPEIAQAREVAGFSDEVNTAAVQN